MIRTNGDERRSGVITTRFTTAPAAAPAAIPSVTAPAVPSESFTSVNTPAPVSANTPCAKFTTPEPRYTSTIPNATSA